MTRPLRRLLQLVLLATLLLTAAASTLAAPQSGDVTLTAHLAYEGGFRVHTWMPINVLLENAGIDRQVEVRIGSRDGPQYATLVDLPNGGRKSVVVYVYLTPASRRLTVRALDGEQELAQTHLVLTPTKQPAQLVGLVVGQSPLVQPPRQLPNNLPLVALTIERADLPEQALGLSGFDALVLEDVATSELTPAQLSALQAWVLHGGKLILGGGTGLAHTLAGLPASLRPATVLTTEVVSAKTLLTGVTSSTDLPLTRLAPLVGPDGRQAYAVPFSTFGSPLDAFEITLGRGSVVAVGLPLAHPALAAWANTARFWEELLRPTLDLLNGSGPEMLTTDSYINSSLAAVLPSLPSLDFPPLGLLIALLAAYIIIVGPGTFLVLRRLDRQALGWVVVPVITFVFAGLTYALGYAQRGGDVVFNQLTLIEADDGQFGTAWVRTLVGVFSPDRHSYNLTLTNPLAGQQGALLRSISLQGVWDTNSPLGGGVYRQTAGSSAEVQHFEVAQWAMRGMAAESLRPIGKLEATVRLDGNQISGSVTNGTDLTLRDVVLVQGLQLLRLGDLAPGASSRGELHRSRNIPPDATIMSTSLSYLIYGELIDRQAQTGGEPLPTVIQQRIKLLDALYNDPSRRNNDQPLLFAWADAPALELLPIQQRAAYMHTTLLQAKPRLEAAAGEINVPANWLETRFENGIASTCFGEKGTGVTLGDLPAIMQFMLPHDLYTLRPNKLRLSAATDGTWRDDTVVELYDWTTGTWVPKLSSAKDVQIDTPAHYLGSHGMMRVRLTGVNNQNNFDCIYLRAALTGVMP